MVTLFIITIVFWVVVAFIIFAFFITKEIFKSLRKKILIKNHEVNLSINKI